MKYKYVQGTLFSRITEFADEFCRLLTQTIIDGFIRDFKIKLKKVD